MKIKKRTDCPKPLWFARARRKDTGEIIPLEKVTEIHGEPHGQIRAWLNVPESTSGWIECELEMSTGFIYPEGNYIYENDIVWFEGKKYIVFFNSLNGRWEIENLFRREALCRVRHRLKK